MSDVNDQMPEMGILLDPYDRKLTNVMGCTFLFLIVHLINSNHDLISSVLPYCVLRCCIKYKVGRVSELMNLLLH